MKNCLEEHRSDADFSPDCKAELEAMMARRASDFRLDAELIRVCANDIDNVCGYEKVSCGYFCFFLAAVSYASCRQHGLP